MVEVIVIQIGTLRHDGAVLEYYLTVIQIEFEVAVAHAVVYVGEEQSQISKILLLGIDSSHLRIDRETVVVHQCKQSCAGDCAIVTHAIVCRQRATLLVKLIVCVVILEVLYHLRSNFC